MSHKLIIFDMDDTLITNNTWLDFNLFMGMTADEDYRLYKQFKAGELDYKTWTSKLVEQYKKHTLKYESEIEGELARFELADGADLAVEAALKLGLQTTLLTGSFSTTAQAVATELGIGSITANTSVIYDNEGAFLDLQSQGDEAIAKLRALPRLCSDHNATPEQCIAVGDGANDIPLFEAVRVSITFASAPAAVRACATHTIDNLEQLPRLLESLVT